MVRDSHTLENPGKKPGFSVVIRIFYLNRTGESPFFKPSKANQDVEAFVSLEREMMKRVF
jgi:hypothetical protein